MQYDVKEMFRLALSARDQAYAPYSKFQVGACIASTDGQYYGGCNVENTSYPCGQCAEAVAVGNLILGGSKEITATLIVTDTEHGVFPCGGCLQKLSEFMGPDADIISANLAGEMKVKKFGTLFDNQFGKMFGDLKRGS